jgi:4-hydroxybenzoate polyprenyltransferase
MPSLARLIRTDFWFRQKLPPLFALAYALLLVGAVEPISAARVLLLVLLCICFVAAYGHVINDTYDVETDAAPGKHNAMASVRTGPRVGLLVFLVGGGFGCLAALGAQPALLGLLGVNYLLPTLYSAPPIRFKERGLSSVLSDLLASHVVPMVFVGLILRELSSADPVLENRLIISAASWAFFVGLRGILVHQAVDSVNDRAANVVTFGGRMGREAVRAFVVRVVLPFEGLTLAVFLYFLLPFSLVLAGVVIVYAAGEVSRMWRAVPLSHIFPDEPGRERHVPFLKNDFHEAWLPAALALQLAINTPSYIFLFIVHVILFRHAIWDVMVLLGKFVRVQIDGLFPGSANAAAARSNRDT